jgi:hypothetical protein
VTATAIEMGPAWIANVLPRELAAEVRSGYVALEPWMRQQRLIAQHRFLDRGVSILLE